MRAWMLVFSSALMMRSSGSRRSPSHKPAYRSTTRPALVAKWGSRGKIQCSYCHGLMASASRMRQTVLRLTGFPRARDARAVRSVRDCRLRGNSVAKTTSQATALMTASSRGGKDRLASAPGPVVQGEVALGPASAPVANRIGVKADPVAGLDVAEARVLVEEQDQLSPLAKLETDGTATGGLLGLRAEVGREDGAKRR